MHQTDVNTQLLGRPSNNPSLPAPEDPRPGVTQTGPLRDVLDLRDPEHPMPSTSIIRVPRPCHLRSLNPEAPVYKAFKARGCLARGCLGVMSNPEQLARFLPAT